MLQKSLTSTAVLSLPVVMFESSVNSYDSQTLTNNTPILDWFESSVNSYDSQTVLRDLGSIFPFESSVNSYDSQTQDME